MTVLSVVQVRPIFSSIDVQYKIEERERERERRKCSRCSAVRKYNNRNKNNSRNGKNPIAYINHVTSSAFKS